jgi:arylsulfatase A
MAHSVERPARAGGQRPTNPPAEDGGGVTRRRFLESVAGTAAAGMARAAGLRAAPAERPNIVLVLADDLGYADLSCYGQTRFRTPNVDALARDGVRLTAHYSGSPVCAPSRCALLTGLHTGHAYIRDNDELPGRGDVWNDPSLEGQRPLLPNTTTIGSVLKKAGYDTAIVGKWGLGGPGSEGEPNRQGFDYSFGYLCQRQAHNHYPDHLWRNGERVPLDNPVFGAHQKLPTDKDPQDPRSYDAYRGRQYAFDVMLDDALAWVRQPRSRPFFLHFAPTIPHVALQVPEDSLREYEGRFPETPYTGDKGYLPQRVPRAAYAAMIARMDAGIGRLMRALAEARLDARTLVIFTSDNGATFQIGGYDPAFFASNAPWRGAKQDLFEGGIRVPLVARWPDRIRAGAVRHEPCASWDLMATFADLAGTRPPAAQDGMSLRPLLEGRPLRARKPLYWEFQGRQALRDGNWKAIHDARRGAFELHNLVADPGERRDVSGEEQAIAAKLRKAMQSEHTDSALFPLTGK